MFQSSDSAPLLAITCLISLRTIQAKRLIVCLNCSVDGVQVRVFQYHPEGVVSVKFKDEDAAQGCIKLMDGRFFGGRQVSAGLWDGITNYNVKKPKESIEEQAARLERFAAEIEDG